MRLPSDLRPAAFIERLNRFCAAVEVEGQRVLAHVANSGRLRELLAPGMPVMVAPRSGEHRRTAYDLTLVRLTGTWVSADARFPPALVEEAVGQGRLEEFRGYGSLRREVRYGDSRLDIALHGVSATCLVEVKSVTLVRNGVGLFPDAPTERGRAASPQLDVGGRRRDARRRGLRGPTAGRQQLLTQRRGRPGFWRRSPGSRLGGRRRLRLPV